MNKVVIILMVLITQITIAQNHKRSYANRVVNFPENTATPLTAQERSFIDEAYAHEAQRLIYNNPTMLKSIKHILRNRVIIYQATSNVEYQKAELLSSVPVFTACNDELERDIVFNPNTFNPLKYSFQFFSKKSFLFRVDGTNFMIMIKSQFN